MFAPGVSARSCAIFSMELAVSLRSKIFVSGDPVR